VRVGSDLLGATGDQMEQAEQGNADHKQERDGLQEATDDIGDHVVVPY
jgi:hypothetical protein